MRGRTQQRLYRSTEIGSGSLGMGRSEAAESSTDGLAEYAGTGHSRRAVVLLQYATLACYCLCVRHLVMRADRRLRR